MDLYNNELGRRIAQENLDTTDEQLAELAFKAVTDGEALVIDGRGEPAFSDTVAVGATGSADNLPVDGRITPPDVNSN